MSVYEATCYYQLGPDLLLALTAHAFNRPVLWLPRCFSPLHMLLLLITFLASRLLTAVVRLLLIKKAAWGMGMWIGETEPPSLQQSISTWLKRVWRLSSLFFPSLTVEPLCRQPVCYQNSVALNFLDPGTISNVRTDLPLKRWARVKLKPLSRRIFHMQSAVYICAPLQKFKCRSCFSYKMALILLKI